MISLSVKEKRQVIGLDEDMSIRQQCTLIELPRADYYYQAKGWSSLDLEVMRHIDEIYTTHPYYGARRMAKSLELVGLNIGRKGVRHYYQVMGICAVYPKINLSKRNQAHKVYPYLLRGLKITRANQVWSMDITYIRLNHGFVYLAAVIDWHSRYVLSWRVSTSLESDFCIEALQEALQLYGKPEIFNTDQGVQFTSQGFVDVLKGQGIKISMDGKGRALDNVFIERFWRSLKQEKIYRIELQTVKEAKTAINEYMEFYNTQRMHQSLAYQAPALVYYQSIEAQTKPVDMWTSPSDLSAPVGTCGQGMDSASATHTLPTFADLSPTYPQAQQQETFTIKKELENYIS